LSPAAKFAKLSPIDAERRQADLVLARAETCAGSAFSRLSLIPAEGENVQGHVDEEGSEEAKEEALTV
jgi:hypothetical protein